MVHFVLITYPRGIYVLNTVTLIILLRATLLTEAPAPSEAMPAPRSPDKPQLMDYPHAPRNSSCLTPTFLSPLVTWSHPTTSSSSCSTRGHVSIQIPRGHICTQNPIEPPNKPEAAPASKAPALNLGRNPLAWPKVILVIRSPVPNSGGDPLLNQRPLCQEDQKGNRNQGTKYAFNKDKLRNQHIRFILQHIIDCLTDLCFPYKKAHKLCTHKSHQYFSLLLLCDNLHYN